VSASRCCLDAESSLDAVYFPDTAVVSVVAVYTDGSMIEMATIGREGSTGAQALLGGKISSVRLVVQIPGTATKMPPRRTSWRLELDSVLSSHDVRPHPSLS